MPLITLLTDFGTSDSYVAEMKGVLLGLCPEAVLVDVTHAVPPGDIRAGAYLLGRAWSRFPAGTMHLAVVDPGVGTARPAFALRAHGHGFVGPDNGLFTLVLRDAEVEIVALPTPDGASPTFHGRDLFAPAAAALARGPPLRRWASPTRDAGAAEPGPSRAMRASPSSGEIVYVDRFGTLVTNLTTEVVPPYAVLEVEDLEIGPLRRTFGDVPTGGLLAYVGIGRSGRDRGAGRVGGAAAGAGRGREDPGAAGLRDRPATARARGRAAVASVSSAAARSA